MSEGLESIRSIAGRVFKEEVSELRLSKKGILKRFLAFLSRKIYPHKLKLHSDYNTVTVVCSCGWLFRCDGSEMWSEASHATDLHLGKIKDVKDCPICRGRNNV